MTLKRVKEDWNGKGKSSATGKRRPVRPCVEMNSRKETGERRKKGSEG